MQLNLAPNREHFRTLICFASGTSLVMLLILLMLFMLLTSFLNEFILACSHDAN
jgi:hypothetical protein